MRRMPHGRRAWSKTGPRRRGQRVPAAQELFDGWRADLEHRLRAEEDHPVLLSHLAKYRSLLPSLALLFHLIDGVDTGRRGPVSCAAAAQAAAWCEYLAAHARRLYTAVTDGARVAAALLATRLSHGRLASPFTAREVYRQEWTGADGAPGRAGRARVPPRAGLDSPGGAQGPGRGAAHGALPPQPSAPRRRASRVLFGAEAPRSS